MAESMDDTEQIMAEMADRLMTMDLLMNRHLSTTADFLVAPRGGPKKVKCPLCNAEHKHRAATGPDAEFQSVEYRCSHDARPVFVSAPCPICWDTVDPPMVGLACGHLLCYEDFKQLGGKVGEDALLSSEEIGRREREERRRREPPPASSLPWLFTEPWIHRPVPSSARLFGRNLQQHRRGGGRQEDDSAGGGAAAGEGEENPNSVSDNGTNTDDDDDDDDETDSELPELLAAPRNGLESDDDSDNDDSDSDTDSVPELLPPRRTPLGRFIQNRQQRRAQRQQSGGARGASDNNDDNSARDDDEDDDDDDGSTTDPDMPDLVPRTGNLDTSSSSSSSDDSSDDDGGADGMVFTLQNGNDNGEEGEGAAAGDSDEHSDESSDTGSMPDLVDRDYDLSDDDL